MCACAHTEFAEVRTERPPRHGGVGIITRSEREIRFRATTPRGACELLIALRLLFKKGSSKGYNLNQVTVLRGELAVATMTNNSLRHQ